MSAGVNEALRAAISSNSSHGATGFAVNGRTANSLPPDTAHIGDLRLLLRGSQPVLVCLARGIDNIRIPRDWRPTLDDGRVLVLSPFPATARRPTAELAAQRNNFVNLWRNPDGVLDAHRVAQAITATTPAKLEETGTALLDVDGRHVGEVLSIPEMKLAGKKWSGVQFARADLIRGALKLFDDGEVWVPGEGEAATIQLCRLGELGQVGPDRRRLVDGFCRTHPVTAYPLVAGHNTEQRKSLTCSPNAYLSPLTRPRGGQRPGYGDHPWQQSSHLLVAERLWLETTRVVAMWSEDRVLSKVWWPVRVEDHATEKALAVWMNSSLGLLTILAQRTSTRGGWVAIKKADLEVLPVLDTRSLSSGQLRGLSDLFDDMAEGEFDRLPRMAYCPARRSLDEGISRILGLPDLGTLRALLASEPVVSNRRL